MTMFDYHERVKVKIGEQVSIVRSGGKKNRITPNTLALDSLKDPPKLIKGREPRLAWKTSIVPSDLKKGKV